MPLSIEKIRQHIRNERKTKRAIWYACSMLRVLYTYWIHIPIGKYGIGGLNIGRATEYERTEPNTM